MLHPNYSMKQIITKEMILKIRYRAWTGEYPGNIQKDYNFISTSTFYDALGGKTWKNLSIPPYDKNKLKEKICTRCGNKNKVDKFYKWTCNDCVNEKERIKTKEKSKDKIPKSKKQLIFKIYPSEEIKKCWALENLRLIKSKENLQKSKYDVLMKFRS